MIAALKWLVGSTPGRCVLGVIAFFTWLSFHDARVTSRAETRIIAEQQQKALAEIDRQRKVIQSAIDDADKQAAADDRQISSLKADLENTRAKLGSAGKSACNIPDDVTRQLSNVK